MAVSATQRNLDEAVLGRAALSYTPAAISCGGVLWRTGARGIEICLVRVSGQWTLPRGHVHEDERLGDAAVRHVFEKTGCLARAQRRLERVSLADGEFGTFFLLRAPRRRPSNAQRTEMAWVSFSEGYRLVKSEGERTILLQSAGVIGTLYPVV